MKLIFFRAGRREENRNPAVRCKTKILTVLTGTALTVAVCLFAERLPGQSLTVSTDVQKGVFLLPAVCYEDTDAKLLAEDLHFLRQHGYCTVTCSEVIDMARGMADPPKKPLLILFGESERDILTGYLPVMEEYGAKGNAVIFGSDADLYSDRVPKDAEAKLSWNEIRSLERSGLIETVNGGYALCHGSAADKGDFTGDILTMQTRMSEELYHDASAFCFGQDETDEIKELLCELGFLMTLTEGEDVSRIDGTEDLIEIAYTCRSDDPPAEFFEQIGRESPA